MTEPTKPATVPVDISPQLPAEGAPASQDDLVGQLVSSPAFSTALNRALTSHLTRQSTTRALAEALAPLVIPKLTGAPQGAPEGDGQRPAAPEADKALRARIDAMEKLLAEERGKRESLERQSREERVQGSLRSVLQAAGVRPELVDAAQVLLSSRALRYTEDGRAILAVKRPRRPGAQPEEIEFEDLGQGVEDWLKDPTSAVYLPAPAPQRMPPARPVAGRPVVAQPPAQATPQECERAFASYLGQAGISSLPTR